MDGHGLFLVMLMLCPLVCRGNIGIPVFMFRDARVDAAIEKPLAGHTVATEELTHQLSAIKHSDLAITFIQDELSNEDFLRLDEHMKRGGLFQNVQKYSEMKTSTYWPSVKSPAHSIHSLMQGYDQQVKVEKGDEAVEYLQGTSLEKDTAIYIHLLPTSSELSSKAMKKNDKTIGDVMKIVEESGLTYVAFFTGKEHRKSEVVVQGVGRHLLATAGNETKVFFNNTDCIIYIDSMKVDGQLVTTKPTISCDAEDNTTTVKIATEPEVVMKFIEIVSTGMWQLNSTTVGGKETKLPDISAPLTFCYHCSTGVKFESAEKNSTVLLEFKTIQVQVFGKYNDKFGYAYDCTPFFTIPLWTGLLTSLLLLTVTIYGIYMLSSVQTFDQYDDPKSKPLTVTVSE